MRKHSVVEGGILAMQFTKICTVTTSFMGSVLGPTNLNLGQVCLPYDRGIPAEEVSRASSYIGPGCCSEHSSPLDSKGLHSPTWALCW